MCILSNIITYCMGEVDFMASDLKVSLSNLFSDLRPGLPYLLMDLFRNVFSSFND